jgi:hypothetical protein
MKPTSFSVIALVAATLPAASFAQSPGTAAGSSGAAGATSSAAGNAGGSSGGNVSNPLIGGPGTYGSAAQGSITGGGAYTRPTGGTAAIDEAFRRLDRNGDGTLTIEEFRAGYGSTLIGGGGTSAKKGAGAERSR